MNSLGFNKDPKDTRVVVAMSGGVDSSVVAALLKDEGYDVVGITLQLYDHGEAVSCETNVTRAVAPNSPERLPTSAVAVAPNSPERLRVSAERMANKTTSKTCCAGADIYDARQVAATLGIPHYVLDYESAFRQSVMDDFADSYLRGETPIPCVRCNQSVKFKDLLATARELGADCLATGHYAQIVKGAHGAELRAGADPSRDQSYFLFATTRAQLEYLRFPLGNRRKNAGSQLAPERLRALPPAARAGEPLAPAKAGGMAHASVRELAEYYDLKVQAKPDSQDICFVPQGRYADVVAKLRPHAITPGNIIDETGAVLGQHEGIVHYTIGQRKGLNLQARAGENRAPLFVVGLNAQKNQVIVGPREALAATGLMLKEVNWLCDPSELAERNLSVKCRSSMEAVDARLENADPSTPYLQLAFTEPQYGIAPGQACVVYDGPRVMLGGWIASSVQDKDAFKAISPAPAQHSMAR